MKRRSRVCITLCLASMAVVPVGGMAVAAEPLENAHSHNDYWRDNPLQDALDRGFGSVEADIFLVRGKLLVGHDRGALNEDKTLESLYLARLESRVRENGGRVHPGGKRFFLLIDVKSAAGTTYRMLHASLARYAHMLTTVQRGQVREGAVTVVISGNRPAAEELVRDDPRYAGLDGRITDLDSKTPAHVMLMISDNWSSQFSWNGNGSMPVREREKLGDIVAKAHAPDRRRVVRFWATPEKESVWRELRSAGVDLISTDQLDRLAEFLRGK